jgi:hypothetical protein
MTDKITSFKRYQNKIERRSRSADWVVKSTQKKDMELFKKVFVASQRERTFKKMESKINMENHSKLFDTYYSVYFQNILS